MQALSRRIVGSSVFQNFIIALILLNGVVIGLETSQRVSANWGELLGLTNQAILGVFVAEVVLKLAAEWPKPLRYFKDGWNVFDFSIVAFSLIPATGQFAMVARLMRLLRVVRLISTIPELRLIVTTLIRSLPSMGHVLLLMSIIFYIYAVAGFNLFNEHDPRHWGTLGRSLLTLFRVVTLEDWTDVMYTAMEWHPWAWMFFVSFIVVGTFVVINLFIAVVLNNLEEAKQERLQELQQPLSKNQLLAELRQTQMALARLHDRLAEDSRALDRT